MHLSRKIALSLGAVTLVALALLYAFVDPSSHLYPRCVFLSLTGLQCPGCGSQRAIHALLTGHFSQAWHFNALLILAIPFIILLFFASWHKNRWPRLYNTLNSTTAITLTAIAVLVCFVLRNL